MLYRLRREPYFLPQVSSYKITHYTNLKYFNDNLINLLQQERKKRLSGWCFMVI